MKNLNQVKLTGTLTETGDVQINDYGFVESILTMEIPDENSKSDWTDRVKVKLTGKDAMSASKLELNTQIKITGKAGLFRVGTKEEPQFANVQGNLA